MADLSDIQAAGSTKIIGSDATGLENTPVSATANGELRTANILNTGTGVQGSLTVGITAVAVRVGASALANRQLVTFYNNSLVIIYWGLNSSVTTANGTPIQPGQEEGWGVGPNQDIYVIAGTASNNARITEGA